MDIEGFFPYRLAVIAEAFARQMALVYGRKYGLTREEWRLLFLLEDGEPADLLQIGHSSSLDKVQVSRAAARLADKGLISRQVSPNDRRLRVYAITAEGHALFTLAFEGVRARADEILLAMAPEDRAALDRGLAALDRAVSDTAHGPSPRPQTP